MSDLRPCVGDNIIQPFQLETSLLQGRCIKVGSVFDDILGAHQYPQPMTHLLAEFMTLALLSSSMMKYKGIFTLQARGDGPVSLLVCDVTSDGNVRGCAGFDKARMQAAREQLSALKTKESNHNHLAQYLGKGHMVFTVDQEENHERYQGAVELKGASMVECVQHYFSQSEHIRTGIKIAVGKRRGFWRAGAMMLQHMPESRERASKPIGNLLEDDWRRAMILLETCTEDELLAPDLSQHALLTRLFHEEGVRVFQSISLKKGCRCNLKKIRGIIANMSHEDRRYMRDDNGQIVIHCEFCSKDFKIEDQV